MYKSLLFWVSMNPRSLVLIDIDALLRMDGSLVLLLFIFVVWAIVLEEGL